MINLLPPQQKEEILEQHRLRLTLILGIVFLSSLASLFLVLFLVNGYILADLETQKINTEERIKEITLNQDLENEIKEANVLFSNLNSFYENNLNITELLEEIDTTLPSGTYLKNFSLGFSEREKEKIISASITGYCQTRDILVQFKENLENSFTEVSFSTESWVNPSNFMVNFRIK